MDFGYYKNLPNVLEGRIKPILKTWLTVNMNPGFLLAIKSVHTNSGAQVAAHSDEHSNSHNDHGRTDEDLTQSYCGARPPSPNGTHYYHKR